MANDLTISERDLGKELIKFWNGFILLELFRMDNIKRAFGAYY